MKTRFFNEADGWTTDGPKITAAESLQAIRRVLEEEGPVVVEHQFYRGSSAADRLVFDDFEKFVEYLGSRTSAGDGIEVWSFARTCTQENRLVHGKCPDDQNRVPKRGAY
jgi:hypothetical protein